MGHPQLKQRREGAQANFRALMPGREIQSEAFNAALEALPPPKKDGDLSEFAYSRTLSSSFFLPQSAAACTNARTSGWGFPGLEVSWG
jgi:hypothetical protein